MFEIRGLQLNTKYICKGCDTMFSIVANLNVHQESCREFMILKLNCEHEEKIKTLRDEHEKYKKDQEKIIEDFREEISTLKIEQSKTISVLKETHEKNISELKQAKENEKLFFQQQLERTHKSYENITNNIAKEAINKPSTTNNTVNIRNILSSKHTIDDLLHDDLILVFKKNLTEDVLLGGQTAIAKICSENIVQTNDNKMMICCTDVSRDKFKYMDSTGNIKEDFHARYFTNKIIKPLEEVGQKVYDTAILTIAEQKSELGPIEYSKKDSLNAKEHRLAISLMELRSIDLPEHNSKFMNEFSILTKNQN